MGLESDDNLKNAIAKSVDCELKQIIDLKINEIDVDCRVNGKISTDDWELPMLQKKFQKIISDRILSGHLQTICALEDRPNIRRFFCKSSNEKKKGLHTGIYPATSINAQDSMSQTSQLAGDSIDFNELGRPNMFAIESLAEGTEISSE